MFEMWSLDNIIYACGAAGGGRRAARAGGAGDWRTGWQTDACNFTCLSGNLCVRAAGKQALMSAYNETV